MMQSSGTDAAPIEVLLVEDSPETSGSRAKHSKMPRCISTLSVASDGVEAMAFMKREGKHVNAPRPDLILLDLNLPRKDGREVLEEIKNVRH
jgi:two-component system, chemotaxis family, response regulator Rcp1